MWMWGKGGLDLPDDVHMSPYIGGWPTWDFDVGVE